MSIWVLMYGGVDNDYHWITLAEDGNGIDGAISRSAAIIYFLVIYSDFGYLSLIA
jgi:hypothetical protein